MKSKAVKDLQIQRKKRAGNLKVLNQGHYQSQEDQKNIQKESIIKSTDQFRVHHIHLLIQAVHHHHLPTEVHPHLRAVQVHHHIPEVNKVEDTKTSNAETFIIKIHHNLSMELLITQIEKIIK